MRFALESIKPTFKDNSNEHYFQKHVSKLTRLVQVPKGYKTLHTSQNITTKFIKFRNIFNFHILNRFFTEKIEKTGSITLKKGGALKM